MPVFRYEAVDRRGRDLNGVMPAHDESNLEGKLKLLGLWLTEAAVERVRLTTPGKAALLTGKPETPDTPDSYRYLLMPIRLS